jgi:hypothetical protein
MPESEGRIEGPRNSSESPVGYSEGGSLHEVDRTGETGFWSVLHVQSLRDER